MAAMCVCSSHVIITRFITRSRDHYVARGTMAVFSDFVSFLFLLDCQEAFHCCLVVACINRINMISIECHRVGEWWPGKREFDNRIESVRGNHVAIPFNKKNAFFKTSQIIPRISQIIPRISLKSPKMVKIRLSLPYFQSKSPPDGTKLHI